MKKSNHRREPKRLTLNYSNLKVACSSRMRTIFRIGFTHFDVRLVFGEVVDVGQGSVSVEQRARVTLSLPPGMTELQDLTRKQKRQRA